MGVFAFQVTKRPQEVQPRNNIRRCLIVSRMSRKRKEEGALFLNECNRITYNELCRMCGRDCMQSSRSLMTL